ncbi:MAG: HlyD family efflux transporter periplasmic adaptor subunit [Planctomycetales bacterium]
MTMTSIRTLSFLTGLLGLTLSLPATSFAQSVNLQREALQVQSASNFYVALSLQPQKTQIVSAPSTGVILNVLVKRGDKVSAQGDILRLDDARQQLVVTRAKALTQAARVEVKLTEGKGDQNEIAKAKLAAAEAELAIASYDLDHLACKAPFSGLILDVHVLPGQTVRQGDPLVTIADVTRLQAEIPVDRLQTKVGGEVEFLIDQGARKGKVIALLPPTKKLELLRPIIPGLSMALLDVENEKGELLAGQTIFSRLVPQFAVCDVPVTSLSNYTEGRRKVQVLRNGVVRDIVVEALTQKGTERLFVTGRFSPSDELIVTSSIPLKDGQRLEAQVSSAGTAAGGGDGKPATPTAKPQLDPSKGF